MDKVHAGGSSLFDFIFISEKLLLVSTIVKMNYFPNQIAFLFLTSLIIIDFITNSYYLISF